MKKSYLHFALELAEQEDLPVVATNEVVFISEDLLTPMKSVWRFDGFMVDPRRPKTTAHNLPT